MLLFTVYSKQFYIFYLLAGLTDMIDGTIARRLDAVSDFGSKLDTISDIIFVAAATYKILPTCKVNIAILIWTGIIALIKIVNNIIGFAIHKKFAAVHSVLNKVTGLLLFVLPFTFKILDMNYTSAVICLIATVAALQEFYFIKKTDNPIP